MAGDEGDKLGFHAESGGGDPIHLRSLDVARGRDLRALGASETFVERALSTPPADMWYPSNRELIEKHLIDVELGDR